MVSGRSQRKTYTGTGTWVSVENTVLAGSVCVLVESCVDTNVLVMNEVIGGGVTVTLKVCAGRVTWWLELVKIDSSSEYPAQSLQESFEGFIRLTYCNMVSEDLV